LAQDAGGLGGAAAQLMQNMGAQQQAQVLGNANLQMQAAALAGERGQARNALGELQLAVELGPGAVRPAANVAPLSPLQLRLQENMRRLEALGVPVPAEMLRQFADLMRPGPRVNQREPVLPYEFRGAPREMGAEERDQRNTMINAGRLQDLEQGDAELQRRYNPTTQLENLYGRLKSGVVGKLSAVPGVAAMVAERQPRQTIQGAQSERFKEAVAIDARKKAQDAAELAERENVIRGAAAGRIDPGANLDQRPGQIGPQPRVDAPAAAPVYGPAPVPPPPPAPAGPPQPDLWGAVPPDARQMNGRGAKRALAPHQVKGSKAAKEHMAALRAKRTKK
jgi:hypothetical protein